MSQDPIKLSDGRFTIVRVMLKFGKFSLHAEVTRFCLIALEAMILSSLIPRPCPAFRRLQYGKAGYLYCKRRKAAWGLGTRLDIEAITTDRSGHKGLALHPYAH